MSEAKQWWTLKPGRERQRLKDEQLRRIADRNREAYSQREVKRQEKPIEKQP